MPVIIGIDPHKSTHTAVAIDVEERPLARLQLPADLAQVGRLLAWATPLGDERTDAVVASRTTLLEVHGVGPVVAGFILGHVGDPTRFATAKPLRLPQRDRSRRSLQRTTQTASPQPSRNRKLNHALHMAAVTQLSHTTPGRTYYDRKRAEGKSNKEALRALKRRISAAVWRQLQVDLARH
jgi:hypothetical protein